VVTPKSKATKMADLNVWFQMLRLSKIVFLLRTKVSANCGLSCSHPGVAGDRSGEQKQLD
jgi:hypothetical protein